MLQDRCPKCGLPLEVEERQIVGLGDTCEANCHIAYLACVERLKEKRDKLELNSMTQFNFMAMMANPLNMLQNTIKDQRKSTVVPLLEKTLDRLSTALASHNPGEILPWQIVLDSFSMARNGNPDLTNAIHQSLIDLGFAGFVALATGDFCLGNVVLRYLPEKNVIEAEMNIRRSAAKTFNDWYEEDPKSVKRDVDGLIWHFHLKHAQGLLDTILLRYPLPESRKIEDSFWVGLELSKNLPPEAKEVKPSYFYPGLMTSLIPITIQQKTPQGVWTWSYHKYQQIYPYMLSEGKALYYKEMCTEDKKVYLVPQENVEKVLDFLQKLQDLPEGAPKKNSKDRGPVRTKLR